MSIIFFTGFPGFLGSQLLPRVLARSPEHEALCLVQPGYLALARERAAAITAAHGLDGRIRIEAGDITEPRLGLADARGIQRETREVFHLAAIYDLSVGRKPARRVNLDGTRNVLDFAGECPLLHRVQYVSTCYVSGRWPGVFSESDLEVGQEFNNHYEETKYLAEVEVQHAMRAGLPATVYRPAIVVGDSATGETQKYDGPYFVMQWLLRQGPVAVMPVVGEATRTELNVVPRDFVVDAISYLSARPASEGAVYHLADPHPLTVDEILELLGRIMDKRILRVPLPIGVAKGAIRYLPGVYPLMRIPHSALDYFVHPTRYATEQTQAALAGSGIAVPRFAEYAARLLAFMRQHPEVGAQAMA
jgi:thioester reductase-like protein